MTHIEDYVFDKGTSGLLESVRFLKEVVRMLSGNSKGSYNITTKWDGAPAIFSGIHPETGKFFVGTKSVFNKSNPKINYTNSDIDKNHEGGLRDKLKTALKYLPELGIKGIIQGDMMFSDDVKKTNIDGIPHYAFTPNTITYAAPITSELGKKIGKAKMGIVFHTLYTGDSMENMKATFNINIGKFKRTKNVWFDDAYLKDASGTGTFTKSETETAVQLVNDTVASARKVNKSFLDELVNKHPQMIAALNQYTNSKVREGETVSHPGKHTAGFIRWVADKRTTEKGKLKSEKGKQKKEDVRQQELDWMRSNSGNLVKLFEFVKAMSTAKLFVVRKLETIKSIGTFIQDDNGYKVVSPEGFVIVDRSDKAFKLVDRLTFSKNNFTVPKNWVKG
jgi:hypothetical protein